MDRIYDEPGEVKAEVQKLREECRAKTELSDNLRKAHVEQQAKIQQSKLEIDNLAQELNAKSEEIYEIRQMYEELQSNLHRKDLFLQQISSSNEKLRAEYGEKIQKLEGENRDLVLALDKASARIQDLEKKACSSSEEIAGLKRFLSIEPEKNFEVQKHALKDMKARDEHIIKLEEENRILHNQSKWKNEQFSHLEDAHRKLKTQFQVSTVEWQKEKSSIIDEISSLQASLDAQLRVSESLETQLKMSNQALAHEESRRKVLEIQLSESRSQFDNVFQECQVAKSEIEELNIKRDEEIAELRTQVRKKEILANEMKYKSAQLEQENNDLLVSLKDMQEAQLSSNRKSSSLKNLRNKLQGLEQLHSKCAIEHNEKETEWNSQIEKLTGDMNYYLFELDCTNKSIRQLHKELEDCQCLLDVKDEEIFVLIMVLKSEFHVAYSKLYDAKDKLEISSMQIEEENMLLNQQLESKNPELRKVHAELKQRGDEMLILMQQIESLDFSRQKYYLMEEEIKSYIAMLDESNECQRRLEQHFVELKNSQKENIKNGLETLNFELVNKTFEAEQCRLELQQLKSEVEVLKLNLEENQQAFKREKASLLVSVKDKDARISKLQEQISELESVTIANSEAAEILNQEKDNYIRLAEDRKYSIENLQNEIAHLKNELAEREAGEIALLDARSTLEQENKRFSANLIEKDQKIQELQKEFESLDQDFKSATTSFSEKEVMLNEALQTAEDQRILEIEEKRQIIANLEKEVHSLQKEVEYQGKSLIHSEQVALQLEASLKKNEPEMQELKSQLSKERTCFEGRLEKLQSHNQALLEDLRKASIERENLLAQLEVLSGQIEVFCGQDVELTCMLEKILHLPEENNEPARNLLSSDGFNDANFSPSRKPVQVTFDERTPMTELNC